MRREKSENHRLKSAATDLRVTDCTTTSAMKTTGSVALLGLVLLSCLSDTVTARWAACTKYPLSGGMLVACPRNYEPVCGTDGVTYPNECTLCKELFRNRNIDKKHDGRCVKIDCTGHFKSSSGQGVPCTMEYMPICGTNGVTYSNKCNFCNAVANGLDLNVRYHGPCADLPSETEKIDCSEYVGNNRICTSEYNPLCGSDGRTYGNKCQFCTAFSRSRGTLRLKHRGHC